MKLDIHQFSSHHSIRLIRSGNEYFSRLETLIEGAQHTIHLQVYIFENDQTGQSILRKLTDAAKRGVKIFLVVDAYASPGLDPQLVKFLKSEGIFVKLFAPLHISKFKIGRRLHHKIVLIDNAIALVGGINIADKYKGINEHPWLDVAVEVSGPVCRDLQKICMGLWPSRIRKKMTTINPPSFHKNDVRLRVIQNDWWRKRIEISGAYNNAFRRAKQNITIVASYFLPGFNKRRLLMKAAKRGVSVTIITGGFSDVPFLKPAVEYLYKTLLQSGVRIYEWNKSVLHAKFATVDGLWTTVGSHNLNALSDYGSLEANIDVMDEIFASTTEEEIKKLILEGCTEIDADTFIGNSNLFKQAYRWICYKLVRVSLGLLFFMMRKDR
jgi:cardiolipin synthase